ncbi:hypothetical protein GCM10027614_84150 [Micromonospora vulcania]
MNLTKKEIKEELAYQKQLVEKLRNADDNEEKIVKEYLADNDNAIANKIGNLRIQQNLLIHILSMMKHN